MDNTQPMLFESLSSWEEHWQGMPEYTHDDLRPIQQIVINFERREDVLAFAALLGQRITPLTDTLWYPAKTPAVLKDKCWKSES